MAMIEFEDRDDRPPSAWREGLIGVISIIVTAYGLYATLRPLFG